jgi:hypothetical protein
MDKFENKYQIYSIKIISIFIVLPINNSSSQISNPYLPSYAIHLFVGRATSNILSFIMSHTQLAGDSWSKETRM